MTVIPSACELDTAAQPQAIAHVSMDLVLLIEETTLPKAASKATNTIS